VPDLPLACTVRACGQPLARRGSALVCGRGHAYDIARSGYVNLLQPQDRRSSAAGDTKAAVEARADLLRSGIGRAILDAFVRLAGDRAHDGATVVDLGSGSGEALAALTAARAVSAIGIDLSAAAAEYAARRYPHITWVVANADRRLPLLDRSVDLVLSLHARRNPAECARVLARNGALVVAVPARDDLIELRTSVQGEGVERDRADAVIHEHEPHFSRMERTSARNRQQLDREALLKLLRGTYRGMRLSERSRVEQLDSLEVTFASDILLFAEPITQGGGAGDG
jgi:23S rRNA (guanine745-N1)-methyltransferase